MQQEQPKSEIANLTARPSEDLQAALPKMRAGFCTSVSCGPDRRYDVVFSFPSMDAMQAAHREWLDFAREARAEPVEGSSTPVQPTDEKEVLPSSSESSESA